MVDLFHVHRDDLPVIECHSAAPCRSVPVEQLLVVSTVGSPDISVCRLVSYKFV